MSERALLPTSRMSLPVQPSASSATYSTDRFGDSTDVKVEIKAKTGNKERLRLGASEKLIDADKRINVILFRTNFLERVRTVLLAALLLYLFIGSLSMTHEIEGALSTRFVCASVNKHVNALEMIKVKWDRKVGGLVVQESSDTQKTNTSIPVIDCSIPHEWFSSSGDFVENLRLFVWRFASVTALSVGLILVIFSLIIRFYERDLLITRRSKLENELTLRTLEQKDKRREEMTDWLLTRFYEQNQSDMHFI